MIKHTTVIAVVAAGVLLAGCGDDVPASPEDGQAPPASAAAEPTSDVDPYERYLELAPEQPADWTGNWPLSPEDAQARALGGCGQEWAPGTIDAALAEAYAHLCP